MSFKYFSGFSLENEKELFKQYIQEDDLTICGFSYGAIKAFEYLLASEKRVDRLQLFSPAFFQNKDDKFRRMQLMFFNKDPKSYCENFLSNISWGSDINIENYFKEGSYEDLEKLISYNWNENSLKELIQKGIKIEVFLGENDKIIDSKKALDFFKPFATVYFIKKANHILEILKEDNE